MIEFNPVKPKQSFIDEIFGFDVQKLEQTESVKLSQFVIALSQYLIYFKSQVNKNKALLVQKQRVMENSIIQQMTPELIKKYKTKKETRTQVIFGSDNLMALQEEVDALYDEDYLLKDIDIHISTLIASMKRELTRRESELYQTRKS